MPHDNRLTPLLMIMLIGRGRSAPSQRRVARRMLATGNALCWRDSVRVQVAVTDALFPIEVAS